MTRAITRLLLALVIVAAVGTVAGCAHLRRPVDACSLPCGLRSYHAADCAEMAREVDRAVDALATVPGWSRQWVCARVEEYVVSVMPATGGAWADDVYMNGRVAGQTDCLGLSVQIAGGVPLREGALAHELAHAVERCADAGPSHSRWRGNGVYEAVARFNAPP